MGLPMTRLETSWKHCRGCVSATPPQGDRHHRTINCSSVFVPRAGGAARAEVERRRAIGRDLVSRGASRNGPPVRRARAAAHRRALPSAAVDRLARRTRFDFDSPRASASFSSRRSCSSVSSTWTRVMPAHPYAWPRCPQRKGEDVADAHSPEVETGALNARPVLTYRSRRWPLDRNRRAVARKTPSCPIPAST